MEFELLEWQVIVVGLVAGVLGQAIKVYREKSGKEIPTVAIQWVIFGLSLPFAAWWAGFVFPPLPVFSGEPVEIVASVLGFAGALVNMAGQFIGTATVIYHVLKPLVYDKIKLLKAS